MIIKLLNLSSFVIKCEDVRSESALEEVLQRRRRFRNDGHQIELLDVERVVEHRQEVVVLEDDGEATQNYRSLAAGRQI